MSNDNTRFDLFMSYARRNDVDVVAGNQVRPVSELREALESHRHPDTGEPLRVCMDLEDFDLGGAIEGAIRDKLRNSRGLVVICSDESAANKWVAKEIAWFAEERPDAPRIGVALGRLPNAAFPSCFDTSHLGADLARLAHDDIVSWRRRLLAESHKIAAAIWGLPVQRVHDRWQAETRARMSADFVRQSHDLLTTDTDQAALKALAAYAALPTADAMGALLEVGGHCRRLLRADASRRIGDANASRSVADGGYRAAVSADGETILILRPDGELTARRVDGSRDDLLGTIKKTLLWSPRLAISDDSRFAVVLEGASVRFFSLTDRWTHQIRAGDDLGGFAISPSGEMLIVADGKGGLQAFSIPACELLWESHEHASPVARVVFSHNGQVVATLDSTFAREGKIYLWETGTGTMLRAESLDGGLEVQSVAFSGDDKHCVLGRNDKRLLLIPIDSNASTRKLFTGLRTHPILATTSHGGLAAAAGDQILFWASMEADGPETIRSPLKGAVEDMMFAHDPALLVVSDKSGAFGVVDVVRDRTILGPIRAYRGLATPPLAARGRHELITVHADAMIAVWDLAPGAVLGSGVYSRDGQLIASVKESSIEVLDASSFQPVGDPIPSPGVRSASVDFAPDRSILAVGRCDGTVRLVDLTGEQREPRLLSAPVVSLPAGDRAKWVFQTSKLAFSPCGDTLASEVSFGDGGHQLWDEVVVWDMKTGAQASIDRGPGNLRGIAWVDREHLLVGKVESLAIWNVRRKERVWDGQFEEFEAVRGVTACASAPVPIWVAAHDDNNVRVWDWAGRPKLRETIEGYFLPSISADGERLAWWQDGAIVIWNTLLRAKLGNGLRPVFGIQQLGFSPRDGSLLVVGDDGRAERWITETKALQQLCRSIVARPLTEEERREFGGLDLNLETSPSTGMG